MIDKRIAIRISIFIILSLALGGLSAFAQFSSGIEGIAHDQSGAVIAGATVTVTDIRLGVSKVTKTNDVGYFRIDSIAAATYSVEIKRSSFKTWIQKDLTLQVGETRTLAPQMEIGQVSSEVTVSPQRRQWTWFLLQPARSSQIPPCSRRRSLVKMSMVSPH